MMPSAEDLQFMCLRSAPGTEMARRTVVLSVDEGKADDLLEALSKRPYIEVISMDRAGRKRLRDCPCCRRVLSKESAFVINEKMVLAMLGLIKAMTVARTVILINKENPIDDIPSIERDRTCEFDHRLADKAEVLGLIQPFMDGTRETYFTDSLDFFLGEESHSPCNLTTLDGEVVETGGSMFFDEVKLKDENSRDRLKREFRDAIRAIPKSTITFVKQGQMSLV